MNNLVIEPSMTDTQSGARFGPRGIRAASTRHIPSRGFSTQAAVNPYQSWARIIDCGDVPVTPLDNAVALRQISSALLELGSRQSCLGAKMRPKLLILGGDHSISLPALRALHTIYHQPIALLHFDAHLDTLHPNTYPSMWGSTEFNHGSVFWTASNEGLLLNQSSVHAGLRTRLTGRDWEDYEADARQGFLRLSTELVDEIGTEAVTEIIFEHIGSLVPVYVSIDIDVIDPSFAPGTGAPEAGGWTTRELIRMLRGLSRLNIVGADIVEVAPAYDSQGEITGLAAAQLGYELIVNMVQAGMSLQ